MFDYVNPLFLIMTGLIVLATILLTLYEAGRVQAEGGKFRVPYFMYIATAVLVIILLWDANDSKTQHNNTIKAFNTNKPLHCTAVGVNRIISKEKGWSLFDEDHFSNGNEIIQSRFCEELKKKCSQVSR